MNFLKKFFNLFGIETNSMRLERFQHGRFKDRSVRNTRDWLLERELAVAEILGSFCGCVSIAKDTYPGSPLGKRALKSAFILAKTQSDYQYGWTAALMIYGWRSKESLRWCLKANKFLTESDKRFIPVMS